MKLLLNHSSAEGSYAGESHSCPQVLEPGSSSFFFQMPPHFNHTAAEHFAVKVAVKAQALFLPKSLKPFVYFGLREKWTVG